jgi:hypothetical protein
MFFIKFTSSIKYLQNSNVFMMNTTVVHGDRPLRSPAINHSVPRGNAYGCRFMSAVVKIFCPRGHADNIWAHRPRWVTCAGTRGFCKSRAERTVQCIEFGLVFYSRQKLKSTEVSNVIRSCYVYESQGRRKIKIVLQLAFHYIHPWSRTSLPIRNDSKNKLRNFFLSGRICSRGRCSRYYIFSKLNNMYKPNVFKYWYNMHKNGVLSKSNSKYY